MSNNLSWHEKQKNVFIADYEYELRRQDYCLYPKKALCKNPCRRCLDDLIWYRRFLRKPEELANDLVLRQLLLERHYMDELKISDLQLSFKIREIKKRLRPQRHWLTQRETRNGLSRLGVKTK